MMQRRLCTVAFFMDLHQGQSFNRLVEVLLGFIGLWTFESHIKLLLFCKSKCLLGCNGHCCSLDIHDADTAEWSGCMMEQYELTRFVNCGRLTHYFPEIVVIVEPYAIVKIFFGKWRCRSFLIFGHNLILLTNVTDDVHDVVLCIFCQHRR